MYFVYLICFKYFQLSDQYGHDDYAQLDRWSPHIAGSGYKQPLTDNSSLIYTSDYGSYSSQESNHSGTTCKLYVELIAQGCGKA